MAFKRIVKSGKLTSAVKRFAKRKKSRDRIRLIILLAYYCFLDEMVFRAREAASQEQAASIQPHHMDAATQIILHRLKNYNACQPK